MSIFPFLYPDIFLQSVSESNIKFVSWGERRSLEACALTTTNHHLFMRQREPSMLCWCYLGHFFTKHTWCLWSQDEEQPEVDEAANNSAAIWCHYNHSEETPAQARRLIPQEVLHQADPRGTGKLANAMLSPYRNVICRSFAVIF